MAEHEVEGIFLGIKNLIRDKQLATLARKQEEERNAAEMRQKKKHKVNNRKSNGQGRWIRSEQD